MTIEALQSLLRLTLADPRSAARQVIALNLPLATGWTALLLVSVLSAFLGFLGFLLFPVPDDPLLTAMFGSPFNTALIQIAVQAVTAVLVWAVGRKFGGTGELADATALVAWVQVPLILLQAVQLIAMAAFPPLAPLLGLVGLALYAVLLSLVTAELHGFRSGLMVFFGMLSVSFAMAVLVAVIIATVFEVPNV